MHRLFLALAVLVTAAASAGEPVRIGVALPTQQEERWVRDGRIIRTAAEKRGASVRLVLARNDQEQQNGQIRQLLEEEVDVLILAPHDAEAAATAVQEAAERGVPVVSYDRLVLDAPVAAYVSFDNHRVGALQAEWLLRHVPEGDFLILTGAPTDTNSAYLRAGAMEALAPHIAAGRIRIVAEQPVIDWQPANAMKIVETVLARTGNRLDAIIAPNDSTAGGALVALEAVGLAGRVAVTGQDADIMAARRIAAGTQAMTVFKDTRQLGELAVRMALELAGKTVPPDAAATVDNRHGAVPALFIEPILVDRENLVDVLVDSGYLRLEDLQPQE